MMEDKEKKKNEKKKDKRKVHFCLGIADIAAVLKWPTN